MVWGSPEITHSCNSASLGVIRAQGSQSRHRFTRSTNLLSQSLPRIAFQLIASLIFSLFFIAGMRTEQSSEKNFFLRQARSSTAGVGTPSNSMNMSICSFSFSPGKSGMPVYSYTSMHPNDQISIAVEYLIPRMIYGARQNLLWMYVQICLPSKHPLPTSITLMPLLFYSFIRMFQGFKSQWIMWKRWKKCSACRIWMANLRMRSREKPVKLVSLMNSQRFLLRIQNLRQVWPRKMKEPFSRTILLRSLGSCKMAVSSISISTFACTVNFSWFLIIFKAIASFFL